jgi:hypothetical protein
VLKTGDRTHTCGLQDALRALKGLFTHQATESKTFAQELQEKVVRECRIGSAFVTSPLPCGPCAHLTG